MSVLDYSAYPFTREQLVQNVKQRMSEKRFKHVLGVEKACIELAQRYGVNPTKASIAGLTHDYAKECSDKVFEQTIRNYNLDPQLLKWGNNILHGVVGQYIVKEELHLVDEAILHAIEVHTTGDKQMTTLEKVLYVADYIEENRVFPGVTKARELAKQDLDETVCFETKQTLSFLVEKKSPIYPKTLVTYNYYVALKQ